jgi:uncharacterized membrane protein
MNMMLGIIYGLISMLGFGLGSVLSAFLIRKIGPIKTIFFRNLSISVIFLLLMPFFSIVISWKYIAIACIISLVGYIPIVTYFKAIQVGKLGIVSPISHSSLVFTVLFSVLFYGENLGMVRMLSIAAVVIGVILLSVNLKDIRKSELFKMSSGIPLALITCFFWGIVFFLFKIPVLVIGPIFTSFIIEAGIMVSSVVTLLYRKESLFLKQKSMLLYFIIAAVLGIAGTLFYNYGIAVADVSVVATFVAASPSVAVLFGRFAFKEMLEAKQWVAIAIIIIGLMALAY